MDVCLASDGKMWTVSALRGADSEYSQRIYPSGGHKEAQIVQITLEGEDSWTFGSLEQEKYQQHFEKKHGWITQQESAAIQWLCEAVMRHGGALK